MNTNPYISKAPAPRQDERAETRSQSSDVTIKGTNAAGKARAVTTQADDDTPSIQGSIPEESLDDDQYPSHVGLTDVGAYHSQYPPGSARPTFYGPYGHSQAQMGSVGTFFSGEEDIINAKVVQQTRFGLEINAQPAPVAEASTPGRRGLLGRFRSGDKNREKEKSGSSSTSHSTGASGTASPNPPGHVKSLKLKPLIVPAAIAQLPKWSPAVLKTTEIDKITDVNFWVQFLWDTGSFTLDNYEELSVAARGVVFYLHDSIGVVGPTSA